MSYSDQWSCRTLQSTDNIRKNCSYSQRLNRSECIQKTRTYLEQPLYILLKISSMKLYICLQDIYFFSYCVIKHIFYNDQSSLFTHFFDTEMINKILKKKLENCQKNIKIEVLVNLQLLPQTMMSHVYILKGAASFSDVSSTKFCFIKYCTTLSTVVYLFQLTIEL